jgi:hypothetical protein
MAVEATGTDGLCMALRGRLVWVSMPHVGTAMGWLLQQGCLRQVGQYKQVLYDIGGHRYR